MKKVIAAFVMGSAMLLSAGVASAEGFSVKTSSIGDLLDNPETHAIFETHLPDVVNHPQIDMGRYMTLAEAQSYEPGIITNEKLEAMEADLQKLNSGE